MDMRALSDAVEQQAIASDADNAGHVIVIYVAPGDGGLYVFRPGCGLHHIGGDEDQSASFGDSMRRALERLWPESSTHTRQWLRVACDFLARSPVGKMLSGIDGAHEEG